jgi:hypothetical protein
MEKLVEYRLERMKYLVDELEMKTHNREMVLGADKTDPVWRLIPHLQLVQHLCTVT